MSLIGSVRLRLSNLIEQSLELVSFKSVFIIATEVNLGIFLCGSQSVNAKPSAMAVLLEQDNRLSRAV